MADPDPVEPAMALPAELPPTDHRDEPAIPVLDDDLESEAFGF